jgi:hypothetical protein
MTQTLVALYDTLQGAEQAVRDLRTAGINDRDISLMASDAHGEYARSLSGAPATGAADDASATEKGVGLGAALGGLGGLLVGLGALTIPGIGPVVAAGPLATAVAALAGAGAGALAGGAAGGLLGALVDAGLPQDEAAFYAEGVRRGGTLVTVRAPDDMHDRVRSILQQNGAVDLDERASAWRAEGWTGYEPRRAGVEDARAGAGMGSAVVYSHGQPETTTAAEPRESARDNAERVVVSDYERFAPAFRGHYQTHLAQSGFQYDHFQPAYQYGLTLGNYEPYRGLDWMQIEPEARRAWEDRNPNTWERIRDAVQYGWERVKMPVR